MTIIDKLAELDEIEATGDTVVFLTALGDAWPALREAACRRNDQTITAPAATKLRLANAIFKHWMENEAFSENAKDDALVLIGIQAAIDYFVAPHPAPDATQIFNELTSHGLDPVIVAGVTHCTINGAAHCASVPPQDRCRGCPIMDSEEVQQVIDEAFQ